MLRTVNATRYVTPFREGGSLPALVKADDLGLYVLKFRGAGQGPLALAAEIIAGEIGRALGLRVPELVLMEVDAALGRNEPDYEIRELLRASTGLNLALDFLPGSVMFDPAASDRAGRRSGLRRRLVRCLRDQYRPHGAQSQSAVLAQVALLHRPRRRALLPPRLEGYGAQMARSRFPAIRDHVLLPWASRIEQADRDLRARLNRGVLRNPRQVPDAWLFPEPELATRRRASLRGLLSAPPGRGGEFVEEAVRARAQLV